MIPNPITVSMSVSVDPVVPLVVSTDIVEMSIGTATAIQTIGGDHYEGEYEITPSQETQVLMTVAKTLTENIVVKPIPNNYGLITWNGSVLTVS